MSDTLSCPNCGAPLDYKGNDPIIRCPYCNTSVVVPDNLRAKPTFSSKPSNFTLNGMGDMGGLLQKARRFKEVKDLAQTGRIEEAENLYREITGASEFDANAAVQALAQGRPVMLTNLSSLVEPPGSVQISQYSSPPVQIPQYSAPPTQINTQTSNSGRRIGCLIGCFSVGLTLFILAVTLIPIFATSLPLFMGNDALTAVPNISIIPGIHSFGQQVLSFGGEGTGPGLFTDPRAIAVNPKTGTIYVADYEGGRVQSFDSKGNFLAQWKVGDKKTIITGMAADRQGNVFVVSVSNIYRYSGESGKLLSTIKADDTVTYHYDDITVGPDGTLYAVGGGETVVHMDTNGKILSTIPSAISTITEDSELDSKIAVDGEGNIYLLGTFNNAVFKFNPDGKYVNKFGSDGDEPGQFRAPDAIAVDGKGNVYVSDFKGIQAFDTDGRYIDVINIDGASFGMTFDDQGILYTTTNQNKVTKFSISGK